jgi:parallel beta-helix repeat protein
MEGDDVQAVFLEGRNARGDGGGGVFRWDSSDLSTEVRADTQSGIYVAPNSDSTGTSGAWVRQYSGFAHTGWYPTLQAALDSGLNLRVNKDYIISTQLSLTHDNQTIVGDHHTITCSTKIHAIYGTGLVGVEIRNLNLVGGHTSWEGDEKSGIYLVNCIAPKVIGCDISKFINGIRFKDNTVDPVAEGNTAHDCYYRGIAANGTDTSPPGSVDYSNQVKNPRFINNLVYNIGTVEYRGGGVNTKYAFGGIIANNTVRDGDGIRVERSTQVSIKNNNILRTYSDGINIYNKSKRCIIEGNEIYNVNTANNTNGTTDLTENLSNAALAGCGIQLQYSCHNNLINGNLIYNSSIEGGYTEIGVAINLRNFQESTTASSYNIITNNVVLGMLIAGIVDRGFNNVIDSNMSTLWKEYD